MSRTPPPSTSDADRSGPYSPRRDPTVILLTVIAVGSFLLLVAGVGTPLTGGGAGGPVFPLGDAEDGPREVRLVVEANRTTLPVDESVALTVTDGDGDPVGNATVSLDGTTVRTDADGRATLRVRRGGNRTVEVDKASTENVTYEAATVALTVERRVVALALSTNASRATVDDPVAVELRRADTGERVSGTVTVGNRTVEVTDGRAVLSPPTAGEYTLRATRERTATERFEPATADLTVERLQRDLTVTLTDPDILVGELTLAFVARADTGAGVRANVTVGERRYETGPSGYVVISNRSAGEYAVRATAPPTDRVRYRPATTTLTVERETVPLAVAVTPADPDAGEEFAVRVTRADTGAGVRAAVTVGDREVRTDADGRATLALERPGNRTVRATRGDTRAETFVPAETGVSVRGPWFAVESDLAVETSVGGTYSVTATVRNVGNEPGETTVVYRLAGEPLATRTVTLAPGESATVTFGPYLAPVVAGAYDHCVATRTATASGRLTVTAANASAGGDSAGTSAPPAANPGFAEYGFRTARKRSRVL